MNPAARIIRQLLLDLDIAKASGDWQAFTAVMPDQPFNSIVVVDTAGMQDGRLMVGTQIIHDGFQVQVRGVVYSTVWEKVQEIALALDAVNGTEVGVDTTAFTLKNVSRKGAPLLLGLVEEADRRMFLFSINACVTVLDEG